MRWLEWAQRLQGIAQTGLTYAKDPFDIERYEAVQEIAAEYFRTEKIAFAALGDLDGVRIDRDRLRV